MVHFSVLFSTILFFLLCETKNHKTEKNITDFIRDGAVDLAEFMEA